MLIFQFILLIFCCYQVHTSILNLSTQALLLVLLIMIHIVRQAVEFLLSFGNLNRIFEAGQKVCRFRSPFVWWYFHTSSWKIKFGRVYFITTFFFYHCLRIYLCSLLKLYLAFIFQFQISQIYFHTLLSESITHIWNCIFETITLSHQLHFLIFAEDR